MNDWANLAVEGHFADKPWWDYHERFAKPLSKIVGLYLLKLQ
jgi:kynureninase